MVFKLYETFTFNWVTRISLFRTIRREDVQKILKKGREETVYMVSPKILRPEGFTPFLT